MNWTKEFDEIENLWLVGNLIGDIFETKFVFADENMANLMLFCLERTIA